MSELWTPSLKETPDVGNIYDMMLVFQDQLELILFEGGGKEKWFPVAVLALKSLSHALKRMSDEERRIRVGTDFAWVQSSEEANMNIPFSEVGMVGSLVDVHGVSTGDSVPLISMAMDVEAMFPLDEPGETRLVLAPGIAPISRVQYVEQEAA